MDKKTIDKRIKELNKEIVKNQQQLKQISDMIPRLQNNIAFTRGRIAELEELREEGNNKGNNDKSGKKVK